MNPSTRAAQMMVAAVLATLIACSRAGAGEVVITERQSDGYTIFVVEDEEGIRRLRFEKDGVDQSAVKLGDPDHIVFAYMKTIMSAVALKPDAKRILLIGIGGGTFPMFMRKHRPDVIIDAVDIDPNVVEIAQAHMGFKPDKNLRVHVEDGRKFVEESTDQYDLIVLDAYSPTNIPMALATRQFLTAVRARLAPGGMVAANLWSQAVNTYYLGMLRTYEAVFSEVHVVAPSGSESRIVLAFPDKIGLTHEALMKAVNKLKKDWGLRFDLARIVDRGHALPGQLPLGHLPLEDP